jgi:hypothetical protein
MLDFGRHNRGKVQGELRIPPGTCKWTGVYETAAPGQLRQTRRIAADRAYHHYVNGLRRTCLSPTKPVAISVRLFEWKVNAGAEFAVTQPVFDVRQVESFLQRVEAYRIPIVAGIRPLVSLRNPEFLANEVPGVVVPPEVLERMRRVQDRPAGA